MTTVTAKIQVYVDRDQATLLERTLDAYKHASNWLSGHVFTTFNLSQPSLNNLHYQELRTLFGLKSQMAQSVMKTVIARYKSLRTNGHEWGKVVFKHHELDLVFNRDYSVNDTVFSVNTLDGRVKLPYQRKGMTKYFDGTWAFGTAKLVRRYGKWFLHIPMTKLFPQLKADEVNNLVGVDLGINHIATTYDSHGKTKFYRGGIIKFMRGKFKATRKSLQQKQTPSARKRLKRIGQREHRYVSDVNHRIAKALVESHPQGTAFILEDLTGVRQATKKVRVKHRYVSVSWAFYQFRQLLEYKASMNNQTVILIDPKYTSQCCPKCGHTAKGNRDRKHHHFHCQRCHYQSNDDRVGAMNILRKGIDKVAELSATITMPSDELSASI